MKPGEDRGVRLWSTQSGKMVWKRSFDYPTCAVFSSDRRCVLVCNEEKIHVLNRSFGQPSKVVDGLRLSKLAVSPSGNYLLNWNNDGNAILLRYEALTK